MPNYKDFDLDIQNNEENNNDAIKDNFNALKATGTWRLCCLPPTTTLV